MSDIKITNSSVIFCDYYGKSRTLLNIIDFRQNKSRIPMHSFDENNNTIPAFLANMITRNKHILAPSDSFCELFYIAFNTIITSELITSAAPFKVAELGCTNGDISYNLTETVGKISPHSQLWLISNTIGNNSNNNCLDLITQAEHIPDLSMSYCDYAQTNLANGIFDIVVINGSVTFENNYAVIKEAERIAKKNGLIICCSYGDCLLESTFRLIFSSREEYAVDHTESILTARNKASWCNATDENTYEQLPDLINDIKQEISRETDNKNSYLSYIHRLDDYINIAISEYDINRKLLLIQLQECLRDYMTYFETVHKEFYLEKLMETLNKSTSHEK